MKILNDKSQNFVWSLWVKFLSLKILIYFTTILQQTKLFTYSLDLSALEQYSDCNHCSTSFV